jgi:hydrogenase nickel incorporation protein HypB
MCETCGCDGIVHPPNPLSPTISRVSGTVNSSTRWIPLQQNLLSHNDAIAKQNRDIFKSRKTLAINLLSGPGSGKTTLLETTLLQLKGSIPLCVVEGDQQTSRDAERILQTGTPAFQVNTGKGCHLEADQLSKALAELDPAEKGIVFIENVGNLVCPALFDLGEHHKVVILSVTEGEDKPIKYPEIFNQASLILLNKVDLLPYLDFDEALFLNFAKTVNPKAPILKLSAKTGEGLSDWVDWLSAQRHALYLRP